jgi:hypothetical protein
MKKSSRRPKAYSTRSSWSRRLRLRFFGFLLAWPLLAAGTSPRDAVWSVAQALSHRDAAAFQEAFDPAMPGFKLFLRGASALIAQADVESRIQFGSISGQAAERFVELDWALDITQREGIPGLTHRSTKVRCRVVERGGQWRIASLEPADFLAPPPDVAGMWDMFHEVASALNNGDIERFLSFFDPAFAAKVNLRQAVAGLQALATSHGGVSGSELQPSLDLQVNEGDDKTRTVGIDWEMDLVAVNNGVSGVVNARKSDRVTFRVARIGKKWRIESFDPEDFFQLAP